MKSSIKAVAALATAAVLLLTGCGGGDTSNTATGGTSTGGTGTGGAATGAALTIAKPDGAITTESHNPYLGDTSASMYGYRQVMFETMALVNTADNTVVTPRLASKVEWNADYTELTVTAREGVTWQDGKPFTIADIVGTFDMYLDGRLTDSAALNYLGADVDGDTATLKFKDSKFVKRGSVLHVPIVPKHIWDNIDDPSTTPLTGEGEAIGTGPYMLDSWTTQAVTLKANPDWWGGELAVPELHYVSYGDNAALTTALATGEADWAQAFLPQIQASFLGVDDANRQLITPTAGAGTLFLNMTRKPFNNPALRQALAWTIDRSAYVEIAREGASAVVDSVTGLGPSLQNDVIDEFAGQVYTVDVEKAKTILTDAGYTGVGTALVDPDGEKVTFSVSVPAGWSDWNTEQALLAEELKQLGIEVTIEQPDWGGWDEARQTATFDAIIHWLDGEGAWGVYDSIMSTRWIDKDKNTAQFNFGRYDNPAVDEALAAYASADSDEARLAALTTVQKAFVKDVPAIPLGAHPLIGLFNERSYTGWPTEDNMYASADPTQAEITMVLQNLKPVS
ncbi:ABC transporter substrate-binding protein [Sanguibacter hominis ATCC BAA-789]|uniref:ABC transporter substrate-binding protein n=1 Tax=Sanguibacter hominis ATCC BAA-789 TaxID=1312740 RepID=A0A9X5IR08_9MICO|nr:ABC transporter substrate-binding protein [Sanguibacter hominis]NKX92479.1 ABC transporter substrate-binding protein [Sanguibacter hominis ATCC BAA-789]